MQIDIRPEPSSLTPLPTTIPADTHPAYVYLANLSRILPKGEKLPVPLIAKVVFGAPLHPGPDEDKAAFLARSRASLVALTEVEER